MHFLAKGETYPKNKTEKQPNKQAKKNPTNRKIPEKTLKTQTPTNELTKGESSWKIYLIKMISLCRVQVQGLL